MSQVLTLKLLTLHLEDEILNSSKDTNLYFRFLPDAGKPTTLDVGIASNTEIELPAALKSGLGLSCHLLDKETDSLVAYCKVDNVFYHAETDTEFTFTEGARGFFSLALSIKRSSDLKLQNVLLANVISKLKHALRRSEFSCFTQAFQKYDPMKTGYVNSVDFRKCLLRSFSVRLQQKDMRLLLEQVENRSTGKIYYYHVDNLIQEPPSVTRLRVKLQLLLREAKHKGLKPRKIFQHFDKKNEGHIGKKELQKGLKQLGFTLTIQELILLLGELDTNNDGYVSLAEFVDFIDADKNEEISPIWSPSLSPSFESKDNLSFADDLPDKIETEFSTSQEQKQGFLDSPESHNGVVLIEELKSANDEITSLKRENQKYLEKLTEAKEIITSLEERCAQSEFSNHIQLERAAKEAVKKEREKLQNGFIELIQERINEMFCSADEKDSVRDMRIQAHMALEIELENKLCMVEQKLRQCKQELKAERRRSLLMQQRLNKMIYSDKTVESSHTSSVLGMRVISICRRLLEKEKSILYDSSIVTLKPEDIRLTFSDVKRLESEFRIQRWINASILDTQGNICMNEFIAALDEFAQWDKTTDHEIEELSSETHEKLLILSRENSTCAKEERQLGASRWFSSELLADPTSSLLGFEEFNNLLKLNRLPSFLNESEFEQCLLYFKKKGWFSESALCDWEEDGLISCSEFCTAIDCFTDDLEPVENFGIEFISVNELPKTETVSFHTSWIDKNFSTFSSNEHSSCWPPLSRFGVKPYECVRLLNFDKTAEFNTSRSFRVMAFLDGNINDPEVCYGCFLKLDRCKTKGHWSLCVTSLPPANRPCAGSCVYETVCDTTRAFAYIDGQYHSNEEKVNNPDYWILSRYELEQSFRHYHRLFLDALSNADRAALSGLMVECFSKLYSRFFKATSESIIKQKVVSLIKHGLRVTELEEFLKFSRKFEYSCRSTSLSEMQSQVTFVGKGLKAEFHSVSAKDGNISYNQLVSLAIKLSDHLRSPDFHVDKWRGIIVDALPSNESNMETISYQTFCSCLLKVHRMLLQHFNLGTGIQNKRNKSDTGSPLIQRKDGMIPVRSIEIGDVVSATVYRGKVRFYLNGQFQAELEPTCSMPWKFAWCASSSSAASLL